MPPRLLNTLSFVAGGIVTTGLFLSIAHFVSTQEEKAVPPPRADDLMLASVALPPPPPPPRDEEKPELAVELSNAIPLGLQEAPSPSPVKIAPSPLDLDVLLPMSQQPARVAAAAIRLESQFKPTMAVAFSSDHVFQKSEVDRPPMVISRPDPNVPASVLNDGGSRTVILLFVVDTHGEVGKVRIVRPSGRPAFDAIMAESLLEWRFSPAIKSGRPVRCLIQQEVQVKMGLRDPFSA